jgi:hypothetical protein
MFQQKLDAMTVTGRLGPTVGGKPSKLPKLPAIGESSWGDCQAGLIKSCMA